MGYQTPLGPDAFKGLSEDVMVDIVMCIDITGSMHGILDATKRIARNFYDLVVAGLKDRARVPKEFRIKIIGFRDLYHDKEQAFEVSRFFTLPEERYEYESFINKLEATGGGDEPESQLEAMAMAINSEWVSGPGKTRHVVVMMTDASAHPLEKRGATQVLLASGQGAAKLPASFGELTEMWNSPPSYSPLTSNSKRLVLFTPRSYPWEEMHAWENNCFEEYCKPGEGLMDKGIDVVVATISASI